MLVQALQRGELLYERHGEAEPLYVFKHALTQEVAYDSLLQEQRRMLHARVVTAIEGLYRDRLAEQLDRLAYHARQGELWDKAVLYCRQAGTRAMTHSAYREAVTYFEQALDALHRLPTDTDTQEQAIDLRLDLRGALLPLGEDARMFDHICAAEPLAEALGDPYRLAWVSYNLCYSFSVMGDHERAIVTGQRALALATASGAVDLHIISQDRLSLVYYNAGDFREALHAARRFVAAPEGQSVPARFGQLALPAVTARHIAALCLTYMGAFTEGMVAAEEAVQMAEAVKQPYSIVLALLGVGFLYRRQGDLSHALPVLQRALALCQETNIPLWVPLTVSTLGVAYALGGRITEALPLLTQTIEHIAAGRHGGAPGAVRPHTLAELSEGLLLVGRVEDASALAEQLLALSRTHPGRGHQAHALRLLGDIAMHRDPPQSEPAEAHYQQALGLAEELGMRPLQAHCHRGLGTLYKTLGRREQARAALATAIALYRDMAMTFWLPQTEAALAQVEGGSVSRVG
jgi:tetratricopeptide (TPR) repeat protein